MRQPNDDPERFLELTRKRRNSTGSDLLQLLREHKKWWLTPIIVTMLLLGWLALFAGGSAAPFLYTLF